MDNHEKDQLEVIIAELAAISQVIYRYLNNNIDINLDLKKDLDNKKDNPSLKDIGQDKTLDLFPLKEQEMDIKASLKYIWENQKLKYQVFHSVVPYTEHVKAELQLDVTNDEVWDFLCDNKLNKHFSNPKRRQIFLTKEFSERTSWIFNTLCNVSLSNMWMKDIVDWFKKLNSDEEEIIESSSIPDPTPGLSEFEFCRNGVRYYFDAAENREIEIPQDFLPRPDADAWLNPHSGWMHG